MEVLIAMLILAGGLMVLNNSSSSSIGTLQKAKKVEQSARLLESKMTEMELNTRGKKFEELETSAAGDFGSTYPDLRWTMEINDFSAPNFASMMNQDQAQSDMALLILNKFTEHLEEAVKEMKVSVIWTVDENKLEYSVTTLLVDYEAKITMQQ